MSTEGALQGFEPFDPATINWGGGRYSHCGSRDLLEAFVTSGESCLAKPMPRDELARTAYNLRHYRRAHKAEFGHVGISTRGGRLVLFLLDEAAAGGRAQEVAQVAEA